MDCAVHPPCLSQSFADAYDYSLMCTIIEKFFLPKTVGMCVMISSVLMPHCVPLGFLLSLLPETGPEPLKMGKQKNESTGIWIIKIITNFIILIFWPIFHKRFIFIKFCLFDLMLYVHGKQLVMLGRSVT